MTTAVDPDPARLVSRAELGCLRDAVAARLPAYLEALAALVGIASGSGDLDGLERVAVPIAERLAALGAAVSLVRDPAHGPTVVGRIEGPLGAPRILLIGHLDTVYPSGTVAARGFVIRDGRALGPGVSDDKGGLLAGLALAVARERGFAPRPGLRAR